jgi:hypothetical protein
MKRYLKSILPPPQRTAASSFTRNARIAVEVTGDVFGSREQ